MPTRIAVTPLLALSLLSACGHATEPQRAEIALARDVATPADIAAPVTSGAEESRSSPTAAQPNEQSMLIRLGTASIEVPNIDSAIPLVRAIAPRFGGAVANSSITSGRDEIRTATLELKIPAAHYDAAVAAAGSIGRLESLQSSAEDVGEEYVDVGARLENSRKLEARLLDILATRSGKLTDVLTVERELARVRGEIESAEGRQRYLASRAAVSTLTITLHEPEPIIGPSLGQHPLLGAFAHSWRNLVTLLVWLIGAAGFVVPLGAIAGCAWLGARWVRRRFA